jgi:hypothetical protein
MKKKVNVFTLSALLFALCFPVWAQQPKNIPRIGYLSPSISTNRSLFEAFQQGLRELGYVEGKNIVIERRANEGKLNRNPALAAELARLKVDVIRCGRFGRDTRSQGCNRRDPHCHDSGWRSCWKQIRSRPGSLRAWRVPAEMSPVLPGLPES